MNNFVITGWVARDKNGTLALFDNLPIRNKDVWGIEQASHSYYILPDNACGITWDDSARKVTLAVVSCTKQMTELIKAHEAILEQKRMLLDMLIEICAPTHEIQSAKREIKRSESRLSALQTV
jgi:hypothetical protein